MGKPSASFLHTSVAALTILCSALLFSPATVFSPPQRSQVSISAPLNQTLAPIYGGDITGRQAIPFFILVGDIQRTSFWELILGRDQNDLARQLVLNRIAEENPAFLVILGDLVYQGDSERHWERFDDVAAAIRQKDIPVLPLFGNHEYYGDDTKGFSHFFNRFPHLNRRFWSIVRFRSLAIILLNSNFENMSNEEIMRQDEWYRARLKEYQDDKTIETIIVCCHHPPYSNSTVVSDDCEVQRRFVNPFLEVAKAKMFVAGHCHSYERFMKFGKTFIVSGGGGGPRQKVEVDEEKRRHRDEYNGGEVREFHFCKVMLEGKQLRVQMIRLDEGLRGWSVGDEFVIE